MLGLIQLISRSGPELFDSYPIGVSPQLVYISISKTPKEKLVYVFYAFSNFRNVEAFTEALRVISLRSGSSDGSFVYDIEDFTLGGRGPDCYMKTAGHSTSPIRSNPPSSI